MLLQELFRELRTESPNRRQFAWIVNMEDPNDGDFAGAVASAECEVEDKVRVRDDGIYIGTTTNLANQLQKFTLEQIDSDWEKVCEGIDSLQALSCCD